MDFLGRCAVIKAAFSASGPGPKKTATDWANAVLKSDARSFGFIREMLNATRSYPDTNFRRELALKVGALCGLS